MTPSQIRAIPYPSNLNPTHEFMMCWRMALNAAAELVEQSAADDALDKCQGCKGPGEPVHGCPYQEEINDNADYQCNCCDVCRQDCCDSI